MSSKVIPNPGCVNVIPLAKNPYLYKLVILRPFEEESEWSNVDSSKSLRMALVTRDQHSDALNCLYGFGNFNCSLINKLQYQNEDGTKVEYRVWNPFRSNGGVDHVFIKPKSRVLYLGVASGTTVSHVSDIVGPLIWYSNTTNGCRLLYMNSGPTKEGDSIHTDYCWPIHEQEGDSSDFTSICMQSVVASIAADQNVWNVVQHYTLKSCPTSKILNN